MVHDPLCTHPHLPARALWADRDVAEPQAAAYRGLYLDSAHHRREYRVLREYAFPRAHRAAAPPADRRRNLVAHRRRTGHAALPAQAGTKGQEPGCAGAGGKLIRISMQARHASACELKNLERNLQVKAVLQYLDICGQATKMIGSYFTESSFTTSVDEASAALSVGVTFRETPGSS